MTPDAGARLDQRLRDAMDALMQACINCRPLLAQCGEPCQHHAPLFRAIADAGTALASGTGTEGPTPTNDMLASVREDGERVRASRVAGGEGPDDEIQREIREGTPNTPERVARIRQADEVYARASAPSEVAALTVAIHERNVMAGELARASARIAELEGALHITAEHIYPDGTHCWCNSWETEDPEHHDYCAVTRAALGEPDRG